MVFLLTVGPPLVRGRFSTNGKPYWSFAPSFMTWTWGVWVRVRWTEGYGGGGWDKSMSGVRR